LWLWRRWFVGSYAKSAIDQHYAKGWSTFGIIDRVTQPYIHAYGDATSNAHINSDIASDVDTYGHSSSDADSNCDAASNSDTNANADTDGHSSSDANARPHDRV